MANIRHLHAVQRRRATALVVANAALLVATFAGLSGGPVAALVLTAVALAITTTLALRPAPRRGLSHG